MCKTYERFGIPVCFLFEFCESANDLRISIIRSSTSALNSTQSSLHFDGGQKLKHGMNTITYIHSQLQRFQSLFLLKKVSYFMIRLYVILKDCPALQNIMRVH